MPRSQKAQSILPEMLFSSSITQKYGAVGFGGNTPVSNQGFGASANQGGGFAAFANASSAGKSLMPLFIAHLSALMSFSMTATHFTTFIEDTPLDNLRRGAD